MDTSLIRDVKFNCDVSDAKYWGYFSICGLLMRYRDLFRSEMGLMPWDDIQRTEIIGWIRNKESRWAELESQDFRSIVIDGKTFLPFDASGINTVLIPRGLVYGAGYGMYMKPTFFLSELHAENDISGHRVYTAGREFARDLFSAPGMLQGRSILLRTEPLLVMLWEKLMESKSGISSFLSNLPQIRDLYERPFTDPQVHAAIHHIAKQYADVVIRHELAESMEESPEWKDLLAYTEDRNVEHFLRAVKDLVADTSAHGPIKSLIEKRDHALFGLFIAFMDGFRRLLYPELKKAYEDALSGRDWSLLEVARNNGHIKFTALKKNILDLRLNCHGREDFNRGIRSLIRQTEAFK